MFALVFCVFVCLTITQVSPSSCNEDPCWRPPPAVLPESEGVSEGEAVETLLCSLPCEDSTSEGGRSTSCENDCSISAESVAFTPPPPPSPPNVSASLQEGVYTVSVRETGTGGSGSGDGREAYLVRVQDQFGNETYFPIVHTSSSRNISLLEFACSEVSISYAIVTEDSVSEYSPPQNICVLLPPGDPGAAQFLVVDFEEDVRDGFTQHAILRLSWESPSDLLRLEEYELLLQVILPLMAPADGTYIAERCESQVPLSLKLDRGLTNYTVEAANGSLQVPPLFTCSYRATLISLPGRKNDSEEFQMAYKAADRVSLSPMCTATYIAEDVMYNITAVWSIDNPLVTEAIGSFTALLEVIVIEGSGPVGRTVHETRQLEEFERDQSNFEVTYQMMNVQRPQLHYRVRITSRGPTNINDDLFWRQPLIPGREECLIGAPPFPPTPVLKDAITVRGVEFGQQGKLDFNVTWEAPTYLNGDLDLYELCLGQEVVSGQESCPQPSTWLCVSTRSANPGCSPLEEASSGLLFKDIEYILEPNSSGVFLQIRASNLHELSGNWSDPVFVDSPTVEPPGTAGSSPQVWVYVVAAVVVVLVAGVMVVVCICIYQRYCFHRRIKLDDVVLAKSSRRRHNRPDFIPVADKWEVKRQDIEVLIDEPLGKGAFGEVYKALVHPKLMRKMSGRKRYASRKNSTHCIVAVKMLKDNSLGAEKANFLKEIEMMKNVSGTNSDLQKFVVNMVGCVTVEEPMMLVLEFVTHGDLLSYLRAIRKKAAAEYFDPKPPVVAAPYLEPVGVYSKLKPKDEDYAELGTLNERNLLEFARQIAAGMEYLSSLGIVHRDLACRNILVGEGKALKISDFGMSRLLPPDEVYVPTSHGLLPLRWMAIEALFYRHFTTNTDVWSYGVVLWEICTMGGFPYPTLSNRDLPEMLRVGYRMEKPETCSPEVYEVMLECWNETPEQRPSFPRLHKTFDTFLGKHTQDRYPYMEVLSRSYHFDTLEPKTPELDQTPVNLDIEGTSAERNTERQLANGASFEQSASLELTSSLPIAQRSPHGSHHSSRQDVRAELIRQMSWEREGGVTGEEIEMESTRYVGSPLPQSGNSTSVPHPASFQENLAFRLEQRLNTVPQEYLHSHPHATGLSSRVPNET